MPHEFSKNSHIESAVLYQFSAYSSSVNTMHSAFVSAAILTAYTTLATAFDDFPDGITNASIGQDPWIEVNLKFQPDPFYKEKTPGYYPSRLQVPKVYFNSSFAELFMVPCAADWGNEAANYTCKCIVYQVGPHLECDLLPEAGQGLPTGPPSQPYMPPKLQLISGNFTPAIYDEGTRDAGFFSSDDNITDVDVNVVAFSGASALLNQPQRSPYPALKGSDLWISERATWSTAATRKMHPGVEYEIELQVPFFDMSPRQLAYDVPCVIIGDDAKEPQPADCECVYVGADGLSCGMYVGPSLAPSVVLKIGSEIEQVAVRLQWDGTLPSLDSRGVSGVLLPNLTASAVRAAPFVEEVGDLQFTAAK
ncbi:MAG: hypothetical protein M1833_001177 [Piccolia ochrophora]|nr:MAG: hypothetical protein M1833_001177 [Piccolia ochrophora]